MRDTIFDRWDQFMYLLSAQPRRQIIVSLMGVPEGERLSLPETATTSTISVDPARFTLELQHNHLPKLARAGYIQWQKEPFCVERGPHFEEPEAVMRLLLSSPDQLPDTISTDCIGDIYDEE